jgi:glycosyltransferase involved in cell wall biosynthesis
MTMPKISTVVITYNEERNIERCLKSAAPFSAEILVVDSHSTDRTIEIARQCGARVMSNEWPGYGRQKQFALEHAENEWVFSIDADEEVSPELCADIQSLDYANDGYEVPRSVWYIDRWIKHGVWYPGYVLRLFRKDRATVTDDIVHESIRVSGSTARLRSDLLHYSYRDVEHHVDKINEFTTLSAKQMYVPGRHVGLHRITLVPFLEFLRTYVAKRGFLDGFPGLVVSLFHSFYVFLKYAKLRELSFPPPESDPSSKESSTRPAEAKQ